MLKRMRMRNLLNYGTKALPSRMYGITRMIHRDQTNGKCRGLDGL